jgi:hypothetical protein
MQQQTVPQWVDRCVQPCVDMNRATNSTKRNATGVLDGNIGLSVSHSTENKRNRRPILALVPSEESWRLLAGLTEISSIQLF